MRLETDASQTDAALEGAQEAVGPVHREVVLRCSDRGDAPDIGKRLASFNGIGAWSDGTVAGSNLEHGRRGAGAAQLDHERPAHLVDAPARTHNVPHRPPAPP